MRRQNILLIAVFTVLFSAAPLYGNQSKAESGEGHGLLETIGDVAIVSLPVSGFDELSLNDKLVAYHLYQAAVAGRDIQFAQIYRFNLPVRELCEQILLHADGIPRETVEAVATYLKQQYVHAGVHGARTYTKLLPPAALDFNGLASAARQARENGAEFTYADGRPLAGYLAELRRPIFDPDFDRVSTTRTPLDGQDVISASTVTFYEPGLRLADLSGFEAQYPLNSNVVRENGAVRERVWRMGDKTRDIPAGLYADKLTQVAAHLEAAAGYASPENARALRQLVEFYKTGDNADFSDYNIAWLAYDDPGVDTINGFIENYRDPLEQRGSWEGIVFFVNAATSGWLRQVAAKADYYESRTPFAPEYKRSGVKPIANMVEILVATGDGGPISWSGINLPNETAIRQRYGSKNVLLWNARRARQEIAGKHIVNEFVWPDDRELVGRHNDVSSEIMVGFHEALGHASGKASDDLQGDPRDHLPGYFSWLEEQRADLLALHHAWDPETMRIRAGDWSPEAATAMYKGYVAYQLASLAELPEDAHAIEEAHDIGRNFAVNYFIRKAGVVEVRRLRENGRGKTFFVVPDAKVPAMRDAVAILLAELQRIKSEGDLEAIAQLAADYDAVNFDQALAREARERKKSLGIASYYAYVFPELDLVLDGGRPVDVQLRFPGNFLRQQMAWSGYAPEQLDQLPNGL